MGSSPKEEGIPDGWTADKLKDIIPEGGILTVRNGLFRAVSQKQKSLVKRHTLRHKHDNAILFLVCIDV